MAKIEISFKRLLVQALKGRPGPKFRRLPEVRIRFVRLNKLLFSPLCRNCCMAKLLKL